MRRFLTVFAAFIIMLCLGSVYAWSVIASELMSVYHFSAAQSQIIFGTIIAIFPITMIFVGQLARKLHPRYLGYISGVLFLSGYLLAAHANGHFFLTYLGLGITAGIATGFGYWVSLTIPVQWFPEKKGLITGVAAAGFGLGAVFISAIAEKMLIAGKDVLEVVQFIGIVYGLTVILFSNLITPNSDLSKSGEVAIRIKECISSTIFLKLFSGIFLGTFAGLLIIGSLKIIGEQSNINNHILILGVSVFATSNFLGRLIWGFLSDYIGASLSIFLALLIQSLAILSLNLFSLSDHTYLILSFLIGFGFGGNFVLFAKEAAQLYGVQKLGLIYPYVLLGYAIAGIAGPAVGGILFDFSDSFFYAILVASIMSLIGSVLFLKQYINARRNTLAKN
ncbi:MAG: MFS transporter [Paludibacteraceae bacterium]|nr:MFS transporter [Paludibacteraceae bacterium]